MDKLRSNKKRGSYCLKGGRLKYVFEDRDAQYDRRNPKNAKRATLRTHRSA